MEGWNEGGRIATTTSFLIFDSYDMKSLWIKFGIDYKVLLEVVHCLLQSKRWGPFICTILSSFKIRIIFNFSWLCFDFSWCYIEKDHNFERTEDSATVFLKWTDFEQPKLNFRYILLIYLHLNELLALI